MTFIYSRKSVLFGVLADCDFAVLLVLLPLLFLPQPLSGGGGDGDGRTRLVDTAAGVAHSSPLATP